METVKCDKCGNDNLEGAKHCTRCGNRLVFDQSNLACLGCGARVRPGAAYCVECGKPVAQEANPTCPRCHVPITRGHRFCVACGTRIEATELPGGSPEDAGRPPSGGVDLATDQPRMTPRLQESTVVWRLQQGLLVEQVDAARSATLCFARRLVVSPGTRVLIYSDGVREGELAQGAYSLPTVKPEEVPGYAGRRSRVADRNSDPATGGMLAVLDSVRGGVRQFSSWLRESVIGRRESELSQARREQRRREVDWRQEHGLGAMPPLLGDAVRWEPNFSVVAGGHVVHLVLARAGVFKLQFLEKDVVTSSSVAVELGYELELQLMDLQWAFERFVADRQQLTMDQLARELAPHLRTRVADCVRAVDPDAIESNPALLRAIESGINEELSRSAPGLVLRRLVRISSRHEELDRLKGLRQELVLARDGLQLVREQADFQDEILRESFRDELMGLESREKQRQALREFHEATVALHDMVIDRRGNEVRRERLDVQADANEIERRRKSMELEFEGVLEKLEMARRLEQARGKEEEDALLSEIDQRGYLREETREVLQEQLAQRREDRQDQRSHDLEKVHSIHRQFLALMAIDHRAEQREKERDWEFKFQTRDEQQKFETEHTRLLREAQLDSLGYAGENADIQHKAGVAVARREQARLELVAEVGFEQLYSDKEMVRLQREAKTRQAGNQQSLEDARVAAVNERLSIDTDGYRATAGVDLDDRRLSLEQKRRRLEQEALDAGRRADTNRILDLTRVAMELKEAEARHSLAIRAQDDKTRLELADRAAVLAEIEANKFKGMTAEQILVANPGVTPEAARAFAEASSGKADAEAQRKIADHAMMMATLERERERESAEIRSRESHTMVEKLTASHDAGLAAIQGVVGTLAAAISGGNQGQQIIKDRHHQELLQSEREKSRQALEQGHQFVQSVKEVTQTSFGSAAHAATGRPPAPAVVPGIRHRQCPQCKSRRPDDEEFCGECGEKRIP